MAYLFVYVYVDVHVHMKVFESANCSAHLALHRSISRCSLNVFRNVNNFVNVVGWDGMVIVVLVEKKKHKVNLTPIKLEKYHKLLSSPSSTFFTVTASLESF